MSETRNITYEVDFGGWTKRGRREAKDADCQHLESVPRIARLVALAIRMEILVREGKVRDFAEAARLGRVTRARMTQIMKLRNLAPDIQEQILFLKPPTRINERKLRPVAHVVGWKEQRRLFQELRQSLKD
jgi:hypothetical protein